MPGLYDVELDDEIPAPEPPPTDEAGAETREELLQQLMAVMQAAVNVKGDDKLYVVKVLKARLVSPERAPN